MTNSFAIATMEYGVADDANVSATRRFLVGLGSSCSEVFSLTWPFTVCIGHCRVCNVLMGSSSISPYTMMVAKGLIGWR